MIKYSFDFKMINHDEITIEVPDATQFTDEDYENALNRAFEMIRERNPDYNEYNIYDEWFTDE